jgi:ABC-type nitrate/sulfonate/bicarbonate transport system permease component
MRAIARVAHPAVAVLGAVLFIVAWQLVVDARLVALLPGPASAVASAWDIVTGSNLGSAVVPSLEQAIAGYALGSIAGSMAGLLLGSAKSLRPWFQPTLEFLRAIPVPILIPIAIVAIGDNNVLRIATVAFGCFWPVFLNAESGARSVPPQLLDIARVARMSRLKVLRRVTLPASLPMIFAGLRTGLGISLVLMVVSEMLATAPGLGFLVLQSESLYAYPEMFGSVLVLGLLGAVLSVLLAALERRTIGWWKQLQDVA